MIYLALSVLASTLIFIAFKLFAKFKINILHAIVTNYMVACICGLLLYDGTVIVSQLPDYDWFDYTLCLGAFFIGIFNLMAITTQRSGLAVVSVATKMSLVIPILFGLIYYKESLGIFKLIGIILALAAVYLTSIKAKDGLTIKKRNLIFPALVFLGSGIIDTGIKYLEETYVAEDEVALFSAVVFSSAAGVGLIWLSIQAIGGNFKFEFKNVIGGICLGIPNYFSVYFLVLALRSGLLESSGIFTVNNVAVVLISTMVGIFLFKERLLPKNWLGILLAVMSIFLVAASKY